MALFLFGANNAQPLSIAEQAAEIETLEFVSKYVDDATTLRVYACGAAITKYAKKKAKETGIPATPRFMEGVASILADLGIDKKRFKKEVYG